MSNEFEDILEKTNEARHQKFNLDEHVATLANLLGIKINGILESHQQDIMALDKEVRDKLFKSVQEKFEASIKEVQNYPKGMEL